MTIANLSPAQLRLAANLKEKIASLEAELNRLAGTSKFSSVNGSPKRKHTMSAAARAKIAAAQRARWAKQKAAKK